MKFVILTIALALSSASFAGIKDKKAKKMATETATSEVSKFQEVCGASGVTLNIDFKNWESKYDYKKLGNDKSKVIGWVGSLAKEVLDKMWRLCKKDADYKAEIAKIKTIKVSGLDSQDEKYSKFKIADGGKTFIMELVAGAFKDSYLDSNIKKAWD
ncbi:MAG: hypothetical protein H6622_07395 [Halobacteriovoraceae bacterium]|nr:hypothetical protein [Halobacteriovoraceae bacterium]